MSKTNWFREGGATATVAVPTTAESVVKNEATEAVKKDKGPKLTMTKVVENPGLPVMAAILSKKLLKRSNCGRPLCPLKHLEKGCKENCYKESITYQATCKICREKQVEEGIDTKNIKESVYEGETLQSLFTRVKGHVDSFAKKVKDDKM